MKSLSKRGLFLLPLFLLLFSPKSYSQSSGYRVDKKINLHSNGFWDYLSVDTVSHRLYVTNASKVYVINVNSNTVVGEIDSLSGVHGVAIANDVGKGYISNGRSNEVTVFDLKSLKVLRTISISGKDPDAIMYDPFSHRVFTFNGRSSNTTAIDVKTDRVAGTIALDGKPEFAVTDQNGSTFVNIESAGEISQIDPRNLKVVRTWKINPCESPTGLAFDVKNHRLFAGCHNQMMAVVDAESGKMVTTLPIGSGVDACRYDPETHLAFSSNGEGTITVVKEMSPDHFKVIDTVPTVRGARTMELNPNTHTIYTATMLNGDRQSNTFGVLVLKRHNK